MRYDNIIDRYPEIPYFLLSAYHVWDKGLDISLKIFSFGFVFMTVGLGTGFFLKNLFKTQRPVDYDCAGGGQYDIPSIHSLMSCGAVAYIVFFEPAYALVLSVLCIVYMRSRVSMNVHTRGAVLLGAATGFVVGTAVGWVASENSLGPLEAPFTIMFFLIPLAAKNFLMPKSSSEPQLAVED